AAVNFGAQVPTTVADPGRFEAININNLANIQARMGHMGVVPAKDLSGALTMSYQQFADSARQAGILGLGGTTQVTNQGTAITQNTINSYQEYAQSMVQSGNLSLSGTTNTSYTYDKSTGSWKGDQNGRT